MVIDVKLKPILINVILKSHGYDVLCKDILNAKVNKSYEDLGLDERQLVKKLGIFCTPIH
ncbi:hypothetical protein N8500_10065 [Candidatus Puniceispirillum sp.]|nr:hypothetical protein [Candidatus Puniceispirillum sp.]